MLEGQTDRIWKALADPTRRAILDELAGEPRTTGDLVRRHPDLCRTAVMKHLDLLTSSGLVVIRREGRTRWNYLNPVPIQRVCERWIHEHLRRMTGALSRLKNHVENRE
jgi:DNA-binding transcriptional ArsR family regulator